MQARDRQAEIARLKFNNQVWNFDSFEGCITINDTIDGVSELDENNWEKSLNAHNVIGTLTNATLHFNNHVWNFNSVKGCTTIDTTIDGYRIDISQLENNEWEGSLTDLSNGWEIHRQIAYDVIALMIYFQVWVNREETMKEDKKRTSKSFEILKGIADGINPRG